MHEEASIMGECRHPSIMPALALVMDSTVAGQTARDALRAIIMPRASHDLWTEIQYVPQSISLKRMHVCHANLCNAAITLHSQPL